jgi:hypothetical protein
MVRKAENYDNKRWKIGAVSKVFQRSRLLTGN